ncbi:MAG: hypothetical protein FWC36_09220 [Spirochaetes bacterium]|nr:hypothetical protein [Spirochaetota bacterium]
MFFLRKYFIAIIVIAAVLFNFILLFNLLAKTERLERRITMSSNAESSFRESVRPAILRMMNEINILRSVVHLPATTFPSIDEHDERRDTSSSIAQGFEIFYIAFEELYTQHKRNEALARLNSFNAEINPLLTRHRLTRDQRGFVVHLLSGDNIFYSIEYDLQRDRIVASYFPFENNTVVATAADFQNFINDTFSKVESFYERAASEIRAVRNFINSEEVRRTFSRLGIRATPIPVTENTDMFNVRLFTIARLNNQFIGTVSYSHKRRGFFINENFYENFETIRNVILNIDTHFDVRRSEDRLTEQSKQEIRRMAEDPAFRMFLESRGFFLSSNPREDDVHIFFDILPVNGGRLIGSFVINKYTGETFLKDFEGLQISSFRTLMFNTNIQDPKKKL